MNMTSIFTNQHFLQAEPIIVAFVVASLITFLVIVSKIILVTLSFLVIIIIFYIHITSTNNPNINDLKTEIQSLKLKIDNCNNEKYLNYWRITVYHSHTIQSYIYSTFSIVDKNGDIILDFFYPNQTSEHHYKYLSGNKDEIVINLWSENIITIKLMDHFTLHYTNKQFHNWDIRFTVTKCTFEIK